MYIYYIDIYFDIDDWMREHKLMKTNECERQVQFFFSVVVAFVAIATKQILFILKTSFQKNSVLNAVEKKNNNNNNNQFF